MPTTPVPASIANRDVVEIVGRDASAYLQGQISQDVDSIAASDTAWSLILTPKGKLCAWFRLHRLEDDHFLVDLEANWAAPLVERLERFRLRSAVEFRVLDGWQMLSLRYPNIAGESTAYGSDFDTSTIQAKLSAQVSWGDMAGSDHLDPALTVPPGIELDDTYNEYLRIIVGMPRLGHDIAADTIPAEGGALFIEQSVSFTKGCYTGQELVARIDSRGSQVPRLLRILTADKALDVGAGVSYEGAEVGVVTSAAESAALASLQRKVQPGSEVLVNDIPAMVHATT